MHIRLWQPKLTGVFDIAAAKAVNWLGLRTYFRLLRKALRDLRAVFVIKNKFTKARPWCKVKVLLLKRG